MKINKIRTGLFFCLLFCLILAGCGPQPAASLPPTETSQPTPAVTETPAIPLTPTLGPGSTQLSDKDGMTLLYVPEGSFEMGKEGFSEDEIPIHSVF